MLIEWQEELLVGDDRIDTDHIEMISTINILHGAIKNGKTEKQSLASWLIY